MDSGTCSRIHHPNSQTIEDSSTEDYEMRIYIVYDLFRYNHLFPSNTGTLRHSLQIPALLTRRPLAPESMARTATHFSSELLRIGRVSVAIR
jgi:hypothetical protein